MDSILELKNADVYAPDGDGIRKVISGYSLQLHRGEIKTVTADSEEEAHLLYQLIVGEKEPTAGTIHKTEGSAGKIRKGTELFGELQVYENLMLATGGRYRKGSAREYGFDPGMETKELSRADKVKLMFAQRYLQDPVYIAAEDPFRSLDENEKQKVLSFMREETEKTGIPVVIIETGIR